MKNMRPKTCRDYKSAFKFLDIADVLDVPVADFGVAEMVKVKEAILDTPDRRYNDENLPPDHGRVPRTVSDQLGRIRRLFTWGAGRGMPPSTVVAIKLAETELSMADDRVKPGVETRSTPEAWRRCDDTCRRRSGMLSCCSGGREPARRRSCR